MNDMNSMYEEHNRNVIAKIDNLIELVSDLHADHPFMNKLLALKSRKHNIIRIKDNLIDEEIKFDEMTKELRKYGILFV